MSPATEWGHGGEAGTGTGARGGEGPVTGGGGSLEKETEASYISLFSIFDMFTFATSL